MPKKKLEEEPIEEPLEEPLEEEPFLTCGDCDSHNPVDAFSCECCPNVL